MNILQHIHRHGMLSRLRAIFTAGRLAAMQTLFDDIYSAAAHEFYEDNGATLDAFLAKRLEKASSAYWANQERTRHTEMT